VLGIAAVLSEKQNIVFNSEIEYEFGSREIDVEQAYIEWKMRPEFAFRGGIIVPAIGRFNTYHDSYLNLTTIRPPAIDLNDPATITELAEFVAQRTPGQDGFYLEGTYRFASPIAKKKLDEGAYVAPVV